MSEVAESFDSVEKFIATVKGIASTSTASPEGAQPIGKVVMPVYSYSDRRGIVQWFGDVDDRLPALAGALLYTTPPQPTDSAREREDAERYRWLRDSLPAFLDQDSPEELDADVDAARAGEGGSL